MWLTGNIRDRQFGTFELATNENWSCSKTSANVAFSSTPQKLRINITERSREPRILTDGLNAFRFTSREKASQVLRDAIQARKSFSEDSIKNTVGDEIYHTKEERKDLSHKTKNAPVKLSLKENRRKPPPSVDNSKGSVPLGYMPTEHPFSPDTLRLHHPFTSYRCMPISDTTSHPKNSREDIPHFSMASIPYQYPVTPSSSNIALSTARKRQRYCQESPLVQGYHQYPYPTPMQQSVPPIDTPSVSMMYATPPNSKPKGLAFSSPVPIPSMSSGYSYSSLDDPFSNFGRILSSQTSDKDFSDIHTEMAQFPSASSKQQQQLNITDSNGSNQDLDSLLNDEVLSDPEQKHLLAPPFLSNLKDDTIL